MGRGGFGQCEGGRAQYGLKGFIGEVYLVDPLCCSVSCIGVSIGQLFIWHSGDLVLDAQPETASKLYH